jgi:hypothetical protein
MRSAETTYVNESMTKAASVPNQSVTGPPTAAPSVSIADQVIEECGEGELQNREDVNQPDVFGAAYEEETEDDDCAHCVARDHYVSAVEAVCEDAGERA